jgi:uncharacterized circularly permuted ATP-grasp superfamily protein/uncharacterized alpha-E superfamily protein
MTHGDLDALLPGYAVPGRHFDELLAAPRRPRAHWAAFGTHAGDLSAAQLSRAQSRVARQMHENGTTYNVYAGANGSARPWSLDVLPHIVPAAEWERLAQGLRQRARLLDAMAVDLYGPQRLRADGRIPPALVFGHPGFLRACHGVRPPAGVFLHTVAFDLARGPDGQWRVVDTRSQAPSGAGYALENRITVSRLFPDAFRELHVDLLAPFFRTLQQTLLEAAPHPTRSATSEPVERAARREHLDHHAHQNRLEDDGAGSSAAPIGGPLRDAHTNGTAPHIVLLTPGPFNETYFEHAYLARYLGFTLAEGGDLAVRDDRVFLKTVTGLQPVHGILRRLDDDFCDPLELRSDSTIGVPGLVQAWRAGNVLVANAFGTSVLESPALRAFLPAICSSLLGEPLRLPSPPTSWCGDRAALEAALPRLADMVIKPAFPDSQPDAPAMEPVFAAGLDRPARAAWAARLQASPERYVLEDDLPLSHVPVWHNGRLESRALMLRVFLVADGHGDYKVMPGGLSRIAGREGAGSDRQVVSSQRGGGSKDTWVMSDAPVERFSLLPGRLRLDDIARSERMVSSRAGENLFWLGRYAERSENSARLLRAVLSRLHQGDSFIDWRPIVATCRRQGLLRTAPANNDPAAPGWASAVLADFDGGLSARGSASVRGMLDQVSASAAGTGAGATPGLLSAAMQASRLPPTPEQPTAPGGPLPRDFELALIAGLFDARTHRSLAFNVEQAVRVAGAVRDRLSSDNWRVLNQISQAFTRRTSRPTTLAEALELIDHAIISLVAVGGLEMAHMTRDDGWRLLSLGRHLERLLYVTTTVGEVAALDTPEDPGLLEWLLDLSDSIITYRARYMRHPEWLAVAELLLFDRRNPRSAAFQLAKLGKHVRQLPEADLSELVGAIERTAATPTPDPSQGELFLRAGELTAFLRSSERLALSLSDTLTLRYFSHVYEPAHATALL